ncbi:hypothetical protein AVEN_154809-1 [Araneus ventricosus]|uniref:Uncharacterized protein n=1 Tax=Araneus ventricosus TaxID=182803 RepID=A0A4Y2BV11_ARAVE|nr:hypothetical protein AVEN_154809-1 [Araneus ventricosus]
MQEACAKEQGCFHKPLCPFTRNVSGIILRNLSSVAVEQDIKSHCDSSLFKKSKENQPIKISREETSIWQALCKQK